MVGCETLPATTAPPGTSPTFSTYSGPERRRASGGVPGQIGTCVYPEAGCQVFVCAVAPLVAKRTVTARIRYFIEGNTGKRFCHVVKKIGLTRMEPIHKCFFSTRAVSEPWASRAEISS